MNGYVLPTIKQDEKILALLGNASINGACSNDQPPYDDD
jgi:hypothetical protein